MGQQRTGKEEENQEQGLLQKLREENYKKEIDTEGWWTIKQDEE